MSQRKDAGARSHSRDPVSDRFVLIKVQPAPMGDERRELLEEVNDHIGASDESRCVSLPVATSSRFLLLGVPRTAPMSVRERFEQLGADRMELTLDEDDVFVFAPFFIGPRARELELVVLDTSHADLLDVALAISKVLYPAGLVSSEEEETPLSWCRRVGPKAGVYVACPSRQVYDLLLGRGYVVVNYTACRVVFPQRPPAKEERPNGLPRSAASPPKQTYKEATVGLSAAKVGELLAPLQDAVDRTAASIAFLQETVMGVNTTITSIARSLDSVTRSGHTNSESVAALRAAIVGLERQVAALKQPASVLAAQPSSGSTPPTAATDAAKKRRGFFSPASAASSGSDPSAVNAPSQLPHASPRGPSAPVSVETPPDASRVASTASAAAAAAPSRPAPSGPAASKPRASFARKSGVEQGQGGKRSHSAESGKRSHSVESEEDSPKRPTPNSLVRVGSAIAYQQHPSMESDGQRLHAMTIAPVTFYLRDQRLLLDPGTSEVIAEFLQGCSQPINAAGTCMYDVHQLLQRADASLAVCSDGRNWEVVNGDAPFFTAYHTARLAGDRHHPVFLAFHVRSDVARARVASLLPPAPDP